MPRNSALKGYAMTYLIKAAENEKRETELRWETGAEGQPLYCIDKRGEGAVNSFIMARKGKLFTLGLGD